MTIGKQIKKLVASNYAREMTPKYTEGKKRSRELSSPVH